MENCQSNFQSISDAVLKQHHVCINDALPKELVLRTFSYLDIATLCKCSQVCKFWHKCAFDGSNWKSINLFNFQRDVQPNVVEKIAQRCRGFLRELTLKGCRNINDDSIERFTELCRLIEALDLSECQSLTNETCKHLGINCPELKRLSLASCSQIDNVGLTNLCHCSNLTRLDLSWCAVGDEGLAALAQGCPNIQRLRVTGCRDVTSRGVGLIANSAHELLLLNLNYCGQGVTDVALVHLAMGCTELRILSVSYCSITDSGLRALSGTLPSSTVSEILANSQPLVASNGVVSQNGVGGHRGRPLSETSLLAGSGDLIGLTDNHRHSTSISTCTSKPPVVLGCKKLTVLEAARCFSLTDAGLAALAKNCTQLEKLDLEDCSQVTDTTLVQLAVHCPLLNTLVLSHCDLITDDGIAKLSSGRCGAENLQRLEMDNCPLLTDSALQYLGDNCHRLRQLDIYDCQMITKQGIQNLQNRYQHLEIHAYFAPGTPPGSAVGRRRRYCHCCALV